MDTCLQGWYYGRLTTRTILWTLDYKDDSTMDIQGWHYGHLTARMILWTLGNKDNTMDNWPQLQGRYTMAFRTPAGFIQIWFWVNTIPYHFSRPHFTFFHHTIHTMNALYISHYRRYTYTGRSSKTTSALWAKGEMELAGGGSHMTSAHRDRPTDQAPTKGDSLIHNCFAGWPLMVAKGQACNTVS